jgi:hypothetical protein
MIAQLSTAKPEPSQLVGINTLTRLESLGARTSQVLNGILTLARTSSPNVRSACKKTLESMRRFEAPEGFWKRVEELN